MTLQRQRAYFTILLRCQTQYDTGASASVTADGSEEAQAAVTAQTACAGLEQQLNAKDWLLVQLQVAGPSLERYSKSLALLL